MDPNSSSDSTGTTLTKVDVSLSLETTYIFHCIVSPLTHTHISSPLTTTHPLTPCIEQMPVDSLLHPQQADQRVVNQGRLQGVQVIVEKERR